MIDEKTHAEQLAESFRWRPGMFLGRPDDPTQVLVNLVEMSFSAASTRLDVVLERDGAIVVRGEGVTKIAELRADWVAAHQRPRAERSPDLLWTNRVFALLLAEVASSRFRIAWDATSLEVEFLPDPERFAARPITLFPVTGYLRDAATARPPLRIGLHDEKTGDRVSLLYAQGAADRLMEENGFRSLNHPPLRFVGSADGIAFDVALAWRNGPGLQLVALVNGSRTPNGGSHVKGVWQGVARAIAAELALRRRDPAHSRHRSHRKQPRRVMRERDVPRNAVLVVSVHVDRPSWGPATRDCLHHKRTRAAVADHVAEHFFSQLVQVRGDIARPPWQILGDIHRSDHWLDQVATDLRGAAGPSMPDPYMHRESDPEE